MSDLIERLRQRAKDWPVWDKPILAKAMEDAATALEAAQREKQQLIETLYEIANRAANMADRDAADWMPSIYKIACEASGENPWPLLEACGHKRETLTVSSDEQLVQETRP